MLIAHKYNTVMHDIVGIIRAKPRQKIFEK
jgi:hypothetical protein